MSVTPVVINLNEQLLNTIIPPREESGNENPFQINTGDLLTLLIILLVMTNLVQEVKNNARNTGKGPVEEWAIRCKAPTRAEHKNTRWG